MIEKIVTDVQRPQPGTWSVIYRVGSEQHEHRFPHEALHWRAAEYGIDPADSATLLDIVLHEPHIDTRHENPDFVYNTDEESARLAHLAKIVTAKQESVQITDPAGHLDEIHGAHVVDRAQHIRRALHVASLRRNNR